MPCLRLRGSIAATEGLQMTTEKFIGQIVIDMDHTRL